MATANDNPFFLPGIGQSGDYSHNPLLVSMDMMRRIWQGTLGAGTGFDPAVFTPAASTQDLDRRLAELRAVEHWLRMNLSMLGSAIQALEVQRTTISTFRAFVESGAGLTAPVRPEQEPPPATTASAAAGPAQPSTAAPSGDSSGLFGVPPELAPLASAQAAKQASGDGQPAQPHPAEAAMQTWWDMLQAQFDGLAEAAATSMQQGAEVAQDVARAAASAAATSGMGSAAAGKSTVRQPAAKKAVAKKSAAKKSTAKKATVKKTARKAAVKKGAARKSTAAAQR